MADLTVVIVSYNTKDMTLALLESLKDEADQIIVVDNASTDGSLEVLSEWSHRSSAHRLIANDRNVGFATANNQAFRLCTSRYVLLLNSDTLVRPGDLRKLTTWLDCNPEFGGCGPRLIFPDGSPQFTMGPHPTLWTFIVRFLGLKKLLPTRALRKNIAQMLGPLLGPTLQAYMNPPDSHSGAIDVDSLSGAALMVRKELIDQVGGLDGGYFMYLEDCEWCIRIRKAGWRLAYLPDVSILHYVGASYSAPNKRSFREINPESFRSIMRFAHQHFGAPARLVLKSTISASLLGKCVLILVTALGRNRVELPQTIRHVVRNIGIIWRYQFQAQA